MKLSPSVFYAGINLARIHHDDSSRSVEECHARISVGSSTSAGVDYQSAIALIRKHNWDFFSYSESDVDAFRYSLHKFLESYPPKWFSLVIIGREKVRSIIDADEWQCFAFAEVDSGHSPDVVAWWDSISELARLQEDLRKVQTGRDGELKTLVYETQLLTGTGLEPKWISIENNNAGYDVQSWMFNHTTGDFTQKFIEVKATVLEIQSLQFFLSAGEANFAARNSGSWELHYWRPMSHDPVILKWENIKPNIPFNQGSGEWRNAKIDLGF